MPEQTPVFLQSFAQEAELLNLRYSQYTLQYSKSDSKKAINEDDQKLLTDLIDELKIAIIQTFTRYKSLAGPAKLSTDEVTQLKIMVDAILANEIPPKPAVEDYVDKINEFYATKINQNLVNATAGMVKEFAGKKT